MAARMKKTMGTVGAFLLAALAMAAFVSFAESRTSPVEKTTTQEDGVKKPDCVPAFDPRSFPGHGGTTTPTPIPGHGGGSSGTTPSHGGGSGTTLPAPSHGGAAPSHGGGYGTSPVTPSPGGGYGGGSSPTPSHGGGAYGNSPSTPSGGGSPTPSHGGGAYGGGGGGAPATPASHDSHGLIPTSPGTCDYWRSHPMEMWSALGRWPSSVGHFFGTGTGGGGGGGGGTGMSIQDALSNTRGDGAGELLREGAAALLNSMTRSGFPYTAEQVRDAFAAAAAGGSDGAAAAQAAAFKKANEGRA
uniref:Meiosis 5 n=1 Tax=Oryza punctata TaxID=4537 RepID=A0A0E0JFB1_ORYPU